MISKTKAALLGAIPLLLAHLFAGCASVEQRRAVDRPLEVDDVAAAGAAYGTSLPRARPIADGQFWVFDPADSNQVILPQPPPVVKAQFCCQSVAKDKKTATGCSDLLVGCKGQVFNCPDTVKWVLDTTTKQLDCP